MNILETIIKYIALAVYFCYPVVILIYIPLAIAIDENKCDDNLYKYKGLDEQYHVLIKY